MIRNRTGVFPTRYDKGKGWWRCEPHRATHWEARLKNKIVGRYTSRESADKNLSQAQSRDLGPPRRYRLGSRMNAR